MARVIRKTMRVLLSAAAVASGLVLLPQTAQAKYTAIDVGSDNSQLIYYFGGYCDRTSNDAGADCGSTYTLPYTVNFAGQKTNQMLLSSDGKLQFVDGSLNVIREVDTGIANGPTIYVDFTGAIVDPADDPDADPINLIQLASIGGAHYLAMQSFSLNDDPPALLNPVANYKLADNIINVSWFTCYNPNSRCFADVHSVTLTPDSGGFDVVYGGINEGKASERLQATFERSSAMPEPSTWAAMVLGFGATGAVLRARRRPRPQVA